MIDVLVTNDDGMDAEGLAVLAAAARGLGRVHVVAPAGPYSDCGHQFTARGAIRIERRADGIAVGGTPVDCVRLALFGLVPRPALVLSGVNAGANLGVDIFRSGTVAAAREAAHQGLPAVALSQFRAPGRTLSFAGASGWLPALLQEIAATPPPVGGYWNVNLPDRDPGPAPALVRCPVDLAPWPLTFEAEGDGFVYRARLHDRPRTPGHDFAVCAGGAVALSLISH